MKKLSVLFVAVAMFATVGFAKAQKVASLNMADILTLMPEKKKADEQLEAFSKTKRSELEKQVKAFQEEVAKYQQEGAKMTEAQRKTKEEELTKKQQNLQAMEQAAQNDLLERTQTAYAPIEKKLMDAVEKAAKANGWDFIFDANNQALIYKGGADATVAVKKELGL